MLIYNATDEFTDTYVNSWPTDPLPVTIYYTIMPNETDSKAQPNLRIDWFSCK
jgi:hypothetical protein